MAEELWLTLRRDKVRLCCIDHGGDAPALLLLHGLAGHAREWDGTAAHLAPRHRVLCPEQRGHGRSDRRPEDLSPDAFAADATAWIEALGVAPAVVVGQSLGGLTAILLAAQRPDLVCGLVV